MFFKKIITLMLLLILNTSIVVSADVSEKNFNYNNVVTEYYSDDIYEDTVNTSVQVNNSNFDIPAKSVILIEKSTGKILYKKDENLKLPPASITKIMTMLLIVEAIEDNKISFYDKVSTSQHAASMGGSQIWLEPGEIMSVHDLLKAVAVGSANDASVALAEHLCKSEEAFVSLMNKKAKELGMTNTNFTNACGLDDENLFTTANDVALMSKELISHDIIKQYTTIWMDTVRNETVQLVNTNKLVRFYNGTTGLKTGTTSKAGCCVSATAKRGDIELIAVVMGANTSNERFLCAKKLLDYGFGNYSIYKTSKSIKINNTLPLLKGKKKELNIKCEKIVNELIKNDEIDNIKTVIKIPKVVEAPINKNDIIGNIKIYNDDKLIKNYKIYADESVSKIDFSFCLLKILKSTIKL